MKKLKMAMDAKEMIILQELLVTALTCNLLKSKKRKKTNLTYLKSKKRKKANLTYLKSKKRKSKKRKKANLTFLKNNRKRKRFQTRKV